MKKENFGKTIGERNVKNFRREKIDATQGAFIFRRVDAAA
ncbi:Hypothetical protein I595_311 [Croceitalea dokdonensis DOKDO 023]|uniref:Uncharacterized protein n=1 Tax=Croceitalea dokdonensis DOKDO 023 TaxID=1300341 RepID=A0A0P7A999_9FLAO|nr:Hypothetical protein I595_311 [Croceitalea dokdonensis DOKDO 023]